MFFQSKKYSKAFTLVELLVTISIIGLLTSIVLVVVKDKTPKADIAKTMQWSRSIESLLGAYAVGIWNFDEGTGTTAADLSGYGNDGTLMNNPTWRCAEDDSSYTPSGHGCALEFDGVDDYVDAGNNSSLDIVNEITVSVWIKPNSNNGQQGILSDSVNWSNHYYIYLRDQINAQYAWGMNSSDFFRTGNILLNQWQHVTGIYSEITGNASLYVNGVQIANGIWTSPIITNFNNLRIGHVPGISTPRFLFGKIDDVRIYETALTSAQVKAIYYVGLDNLYTKGLIGGQEYEERLLAEQEL